MSMIDKPLHAMYAPVGTDEEELAFTRWYCHAGGGFDRQAAFTAGMDAADTEPLRTWPEGWEQRFEEWKASSKPGEFARKSAWIAGYRFRRDAPATSALEWHCDSCFHVEAANIDAGETYKVGDSEPCVHCEGGTATVREKEEDPRCPQCNGETTFGFGLAGGGVQTEDGVAPGVYFMCLDCDWMSSRPKETICFPCGAVE